MGTKSRRRRVYTATVAAVVATLALAASALAVWPAEWNSYTAAQVEEMARYAGFRNTAIVHIGAGHLDIRFDPGGFKESVYRDGAWRTTLYVASYWIHVHAVRGCVSYRTTKDLAFQGYTRVETTSHNENGQVFGLPAVTYHDHRKYLCIGSTYNISGSTSPSWTSDLIDKFHRQPVGFQRTDFKIYNGGDVHIPLQ